MLLHLQQVLLLSLSGVQPQGCPGRESCPNELLHASKGALAWSGTSAQGKGCSSWHCSAVLLLLCCCGAAAPYLPPCTGVASGMARAHPAAMPLHNTQLSGPIGLMSSLQQSHMQNAPAGLYLSSTKAQCTDSPLHSLQHFFSASTWACKQCMSQKGCSRCTRCCCCM